MSGFFNEIGYVIKLTTINKEEYEGTVKNFCEETGKLVLEKVTVLPENRKLQGLQNFFRHEIEFHSVLRKSDIPRKKQTARLSEEGGSRVLKLQPLPFSHKSVNKITADDDEINSDDGTEVEEPDEPFLKEGPIKLTQLPNFRFQLPSTFSFIDSIDETYHNAIATIKTHSVIGVSMEGAPLSRDGEICWLLISTRECVYFFDILVLREKAFTSGLKDIMESNSITKVYHDCRMPSDALFHQFGFYIENVFDTQVAEIINHCRRYNNCLPEYTQSIYFCVEKYLHLDRELVSCPKVRMSCLEKDLCEWKRRPLSSLYRDTALKRVLYLRELRVALLEELLSDVNSGTTHFLSVVRDASSQEISTLNLGASHLVPPGLNKATRHTFTSPSRNKNLSNVKRSQNVWHDGQSQKPTKKDDDIFIGDLLDSFESNFESSHGRKNHMRRSLPSKFHNPSVSGRSHRGSERKRSSTVPTNVVVNGHSTTSKTPKKHTNNMNASKRNENQVLESDNQKMTTSPTRNLITAEVYNKTKESNVLIVSDSADDSAFDSQSSEGQKFLWPQISPIQKHVKNCIPAGLSKCA